MNQFQLELLEKEERSRRENGWMYDEKKSSDTERDKVLGKFFGWIGDKATDLWNGLTGKTSANATLEANKMNIENQNYWNKITMAREDNAISRQMSDLQAAGLNPWLAGANMGGNGAPSSALSTAQAEAVDGSKMLQATSAMAMLAIVKLLGRSTTRTNYNFKK